MTIRTYCAFAKKRLTSRCISPYVNRSRALRNLCKSASKKCRHIDLRNDIVDNHKAMIAAHWIKEGDRVLDVGVNLAAYTFFYSKLVGDKGEVIGFEANPYLIEEIHKKVEKEGASNIKILERAASNISGETLSMRVYKNPDHPQIGLSTLEADLMGKERMPGETELVHVQSQTLDDLDLPITFLKVDVEGHEQAVFEGAQKLLRKYRPLVLFEYGFDQKGFQTNSIATLEQVGYCCYDLVTNKRVRPGYAISITDILAVPEEEKKLPLLLDRLYCPYPLMSILSENIKQLVTETLHKVQSKCWRK
ncbi:MAG: FkbM family methyltransferase [Chlamydiales bacterium]|nr:FkbM family methyltransferase [Chlamydiales bacterium]